MHDRGHAGRGRARDGARARPRARRRRRRLAMGKLGGREMTAASDLDLILDLRLRSPRPRCRTALKPLAPIQYYTRLTQRLISAFTAPTAEGILYDVDMRLRPSGQKGPVATQLSSFVHYQAQRGLDLGAHGADPRPRRLGPPALRAAVETAIREVLAQAARPRQDRRRRARHARAHREGEGHARSLGAQAGARRPGRSRVHRPASATRPCRRPSRTF